MRLYTIKALKRLIAVILTATAVCCAIFPSIAFFDEKATPLAVYSENRSASPRPAELSHPVYPLGLLAIVDDLSVKSSFLTDLHKAPQMFEGPENYASNLAGILYTLLIIFFLAFLLKAHCIVTARRKDLPIMSLPIGGNSPPEIRIPSL